MNDDNNDVPQAREVMLQRLNNEEAALRTQMRREQEEHQARLEMHQRLYEEELRLRSQMQVLPAQPVVINNVIHNNVRVGRSSLGVPVRLLYFVFIGSWFGFLWLGAALLLCMSMIGLPIGLLMLAKTIDAFFLW